jgi:EAL domain-containing protein (putative c-di-GMP-specific phosphodiesterase class I)
MGYSFGRNIARSEEMEVPAIENSVAPDGTTDAWFLAGSLGADGETTLIAIKTSPFLIGRKPESSLCLPFRTVSGEHAEITLDSEGLVLRDLSSTNGTFVNGCRIETTVRLQFDDLLQIADIPLRVRRHSAEVRQQTMAEDVYGQAIALVQFDKLMSERQVTPFYQPVIDINSREVLGYEVLGRSRLVGITTPAAMFRAAASLNLEIQLSRMLRWEGIKGGDAFPDEPHLFVNTHPAELDDPGLKKSLQAIRAANPTRQLTLEIHEGAVTNEGMMVELRAVLNDLDITMAYDDFGSGRARLSELVKVRPEYLKFDISLIHNIHIANEQHQQLVASLVKMVTELGIIPLAEGVECEEESETCQQLGFQLGQGYHYGRPAPAPNVSELDEA